MKNLSSYVDRRRSPRRLHGQKTADVQQETRVLTKNRDGRLSPVQLTEEFTSEIEPSRRTTSRPRRRACISTAFWSRWAIPVRQGQLIVTLDPTQYTQQLVQLKTVEDDYNRLLPVYEAGVSRRSRSSRPRRSSTCSAKWSPTSRRISRSIRPLRAWSRPATTSRATCSPRSLSCISCRSIR